MAGSVRCPPEAALEQFLAGLVSDKGSAQLEVHVAGCSACQERLGRLRPRDTLALALQAFAKEDPPDDDAAVSQLIRRLGGQPRLEEGTESPTLQPDVGDTPSASRTSRPSSWTAGGRLGPYRILGILGAGGMGVVYEAEDPDLRRRVAVKVLKAPVEGGQAARQRFLREAQATAGLQHDHIVPIYHVGEHDGAPFLVMPLLQGETLNARLSRDRCLPTAEVLRIGREIAEGLAAAHGQGIVHRDVKPGNVWLESRVSGGKPRVRLLDFGLARKSDGEPHLTETGMVVGTPAFMAPEQASGAEADPRGDLFSLGCVLYQACTGRPPFRGRDTLLTLVSAATDQPPEPRALNPDVPAGLSRLVMHLLEKDPAWRPASARDVAETLRCLETPESSRRRPWRWLAAATAAALLGAVVFFSPAILRIVRDEGVLVIRTADKDVRVLVSPEKGEVTLIDTRSGKEVTLKAGRYRLQLAGGQEGLSLATDKFTLQRGGREIVAVELLPIAARLDRPSEPRLAIPPPLVTYELAETRSAELGLSPLPHPGFSDDGRLVVTGGQDRIVRVWETANGRLVKRLEDGDENVTCATLSRGGRLMLSGGGEVFQNRRRQDGSDFALRLWDLTSGRVLHRLKGHTGPVWAVAISPDGSRALSGSKDMTLRLWDLRQGKQLHVFAENDTRVWCVQFSPDGRLALSGGRKRAVHVWDLEARKERMSLEGHTASVMDVAFSADGCRAVTASLDRTARVWDIKTGQSLVRLEGHETGLATAAFSPDGRLVLTASGARARPEGGYASASHDFLLRLWEADSGRQVGSFAGHTRMPRAVTFLPDGRSVLSVADDATIRLLTLTPKTPR